MLLEIKGDLADDSVCMLHELASEQKNYPLVIEISARCYQIEPSQKMALNNARAFAHENEPKHAGGWLQTAWQYGSFDLNQLLQEEVFQPIKNHREFQEFIQSLQ